ncbi:3'-5' exonuclease [Gulosibacter bifidus]|uniref:3'-5' exonuclease n=1 Tax=Gulosibacter bifidus TaxID=272239 RepID=A0ABW5RIQ1_9MICO|nr:3'-5' exonuclease [Gulosibacter bifidus]
MSDASAVAAPSAQWADRVVVFDTETTGIDPMNDRIVTAFFGILDADGEVERGTDWLADPGIEIPERATAVHGVTTETAQSEGEPAAEVIAKLAKSLEWVARSGLPLVVFNAPYDLTLLAAECNRHGVPFPPLGKQVIDPLVIDRQVDKFRKGKRTLTDSAPVYGVELLDAHDAGADAIASGQVAQAMARKYPDQLAIPLAELHDLQAQWADAQATDFESYMRRQRDPNFTADRGWPIRG